MCRSISIWRALSLGLCVCFGAGDAWPQGTRELDGDGNRGAKPALTQVRHASFQGSTRVTLELSDEVRFETHVLKADSKRGLPPRIYVDLIGARLAAEAAQPLWVREGPVEQVRTGQFSPDVVRVVLDLNGAVDHKAFLLPDPYRLVIDIEGQGNGGASLPVKDKEAGPAKGAKTPRMGRWKVVLDPGHGGKDPGAVGVGGVAEKDIVLSIAKRLAKKLRKERGVEVVLTRQDDVFIPLEDRTAIANKEDAELFISLHTNSSPHSGARGIETYYLDNTNDEASIRLAARENATSRKSISDLQFILSDLVQNSKLEDSISLAHHLHATIVSHVERRYGDVKDLGVKKSLFYVLVGARMPSILVELFFITNKKEGRALGTAAYQEAIAEALYQGIKKYREGAQVVKNL